MADGKNKKGRLPSQSSLYFRIVVGVYLFYLAYTIVENIGTATGADFVIFVTASVAFIVIGLVIAISAVKALKTGTYQNGAGDVADKGADTETASGTNVRKRIRFDEDDDYNA